MKQIRASVYIRNLLLLICFLCVTASLVMSADVIMESKAFMSLTAGERAWPNKDINEGLNSTSLEGSNTSTQKSFAVQLLQQITCTRLLWLAIVITLLVCLILLWNHLLRYKMNERTLKLQRSEAKYRRVVDSLGADYIFYTINPRGLLTYVSPSAYEMMGYQPEEAIGKHFSIFHTDTSITVKQAVASTEKGLQGENVLPFEGELRHKDGTLVMIETTETPIFDEQGNVVALEGLLHNITQRKQTEQELHKYRENLEALVDERTLESLILSRAVEQSHSTIIITDINGDIEFVNPAFTRVSGFTEAEVLGKNPKILQSDSHPVIFYQSMWDTLVAGEVWQGEIHSKRKDGSLYWEYSTISPVKDQAGKITHYVAIKDDITSRKETEQQLIKAQHQAETANQAKSDFLANMSHDIRTPMNGIIGLTRLVLATKLSVEQQKQLEKIQLSAEGLLGLLNDILDFSKIEAGQLLIEKNDFSLAKMLFSVSSMMEHGAESKGLELTIDNADLELSLFVKGDELRLRQILVNLVGNSIKFSKQGPIIVEVAPQHREDSQLKLHFMVSDTGIGIPADRHDSVFTSFNQADTSISRKFGGTGLGLAICKQLAELMGGEIWIENNTPQGTIFHFTVVVERGSEKAQPQLDSTIFPIKKMRILLVEDNAINCEIVTLVLEKDGHQVISAQNGLVSLGLLSIHQFDLIIMDVQMPIMDGLEATTIIRASEEGMDLARFKLPQSLPERLAQQCKGKYIPIIAMTANAMEGDKERCLKAGMDTYLTKPFEPAQLRAKVVNMEVASLL
jgi:PAS domain S-box-containing protein